jgi:hypothetical protein
LEEKNICLPERAIAPPLEKSDVGTADRQFPNRRSPNFPTADRQFPTSPAEKNESAGVNLIAHKKALRG